uniref:Agenet-like domain-containing protein n=1 Tax=Macrostomum lignano TaxID=282301 RepID=A0A1I8JRS2_9PLAT
TRTNRRIKSMPFECCAAMSQHLRASRRVDMRGARRRFQLPDVGRTPSDVQLIKTANGVGLQRPAEAALRTVGAAWLCWRATASKPPEWALRVSGRSGRSQHFVADAGVRKIPANWRRSVNGHAFRGPSSVLPDAGQSVQVLADIGDRVHQAYCIAVLTSDGWELTLSPLDCPLRVRLSLGPDESGRSGKLLVAEAGPPRILQLASLPTPMLHHLLDSLTQEEEEAEIAATKACFRWAKAAHGDGACRRGETGSTVATLRREPR